MDAGEYHLLFEAYLEGTLTESQARDLAQWLRQDEALLGRFIREWELCNLLSHAGDDADDSEEFVRSFWERVRAEETADQFASDFEKRIGQAGAAGRSSSDLLGAIEKDEHLRAQQAAEETRDRTVAIRRIAEAAFERFRAEERRRQEELAYKLYRARHRRLLAGMGSLAALLVIVLCAWIFEPRPAPPTIVSPAPASPPVLARISDSLDAQWRNAGLLAEPGTELPGGSMYLQQGLVCITFNCGADVIVEAPAEIDIEAADRMLLQHGRLAAKAGKEAIGFTVRTPGATVVDYGTEFGISVSRSGQTETHVFKGQVEVRSGPNAQVFEESRRLTAHQACAVDREGKLSQANLIARPELFQRHVPSPYELAVLDTHPTVYWRFDAGDPNRFVNVMDPHAGSGRFLGPVEFSVGPGLGAGKQAQAIELDGNGGRALVADASPPSGVQATGYTYVMWVRPDEIREQFILTTTNKTGARRVVAMTADGRLDHYFVDNRGNHIAHVLSRTATRPGLWYHVAILRTAYGDRQLFINGVLDASTSASEWGRPDFHRTFCLGATDKEEHMEGLAPWRGGISEVAIYCRALGEWEIRNLYASSQER